MGILIPFFVAVIHGAVRRYCLCFGDIRNTEVRIYSLCGEGRADHVTPPDRGEIPVATVGECQHSVVGVGDTDELLVIIREGCPTAADVNYGLQLPIWIVAKGNCALITADDPFDLIGEILIVFKCGILLVLIKNNRQSPVCVESAGDLTVGQIFDRFLHFQRFQLFFCMNELAVILPELFQCICISALEKIQLLVDRLKLPPPLVICFIQLIHTQISLIQHRNDLGTKRVAF